MGDSAEHGGPAFETILSQEEIEYLQLMMPKGFTLVTTPKISSVVSKPSKSGASTSNIKGHGVNGVEPSEHDSNWANNKKIPRAFGKEGKVVTPTTMVPIQTVSMSGNLQTSSTGVTTRPANKQAPVFSELMKKCQTLLKRLQSHNCAAPFLEPVDYKTLNIPDYPLIVKEPMDLSTVEKKLKDGLYANPTAFGADVRKIWANAFLYNPKTHQIWDMTKRMQDFFEKNFKEVEDSPLADGNLATFVDTKLSAANKKIDTLKTKGAHSEVEQQLKPMTTEEKFNLALHIRSNSCYYPDLPGVMLEGIREILIEDTPSFKDKTTIEFDLSKLPTVVLRKLEKHCKSKNAAFTNQLPQKPGKSQDGSEGVSVIRPEGEPTQRVRFC